MKLKLVVGHFPEVYQYPLVLKLFLLLQSSEQKLKTPTKDTRVKMAFAAVLLCIRVVKLVFEINIDRLICNPFSQHIQIREVKLSACVCMEQNTLLFEE